MRILLLLFLCSMLLIAEGLFNEEKQSYEKSKNNPELLVFVTSHIIPINKSFIKDTPYGRVISIPQEALNPQEKTQTMSKGMYNKGNYTVFRSNNNAITFYRYSRNNSNLYARIAPNIYTITHITGTFYKVEPMPEKLSLCSIIVSRIFEAEKTSSPQILLDLDNVPNRGVAKLLLECPKPNEKFTIDGYNSY